MTAYLIRKDGAFQWIVSKWDFSVIPIEVYRVKQGTNKMSCSCASGYNRGYCKHTDMVKDWVKRGCPEGDIVG
jgi:hypothetical protein